MGRIKSRISGVVVLAMWVLIVLILSMSFSLNDAMFAFAVEDIQSLNEATAHVAEEFEDDNVIVVLDPKISKINKIHNAKFFDGIAVESITDLTKRERNLSSKNSEFKQILQIRLKEKSKENVLRAISRLERLDGVLSAEPNYLFQASVDPNDSYYLYGNLWGLNGKNGIDAPNAWNFTTGSKTIRVGIIDTGIANHEDLNANLADGIDTFNNNNITNDVTHYHGTHVAGTVGAVGNNRIGVVGINWNVTLVPLQAENEINRFPSTNVVAAIEWAQDKWGTDEQISILNYSVGGFGETTAVRAAVSQFDGLFVWAAGNETEDIDEQVSIHGSFNLDNLISVGALNQDATRRSTSNYSKNNTNVHIYAPGTEIYSTVPTSFDASGYTDKSGTSMAAPHVTGVAALMLSVNPSMSGVVGTTLGARLKTAIINNADTIALTIPNGSSGTVSQNVRKLNAFQSVASVSLAHTKDGDNATITGVKYGVNLSGNITLPKIINGKTVTQIADYAFANQTEITEITIPSTVTEIGKDVFLGCDALKKINVESGNPKFVSHNGILYNKAKTAMLCVPKGLSGDVVIPNGVTKIPDYAFDGRTSVTGISLPNTLAQIGVYAFAGCTGINNVEIPGSVITLGNNAFQNCSNLTTLTLQSGVNELGDYAFAGCGKIQSLTIPQSIKKIGANTFSSGSSQFAITWHYNPSYTASDLNLKGYLNNIIFDSNVTSIAAYAFSNCNRVESVKILAGVKSIGTYAFSAMNGLERVIIPSSVTNIGSFAFSACNSLKIYSETTSKPSGWDSNWNPSHRPEYYYSSTSKVNCWRYVNQVPTVWALDGTEGLEYALLDNGTFAVVGTGAKNLTSIVIPATYNNRPVTKVGSGVAALSDSYYLQTVVIHEGITAIAPYAFSDCRQLSSVTLPATLTTIGEKSFYNCRSLTTTTLPDNLTSIGASAFSDCTRLSSIKIPKNVVSVGENAFANCANSLFIVWNYNPALTAENFNTIHYEVVFPEGTTRISANAFANSTTLNILTIPNTVTSVGANAFANCNPYLSVTWYYNQALTASEFHPYLLKVYFNSNTTKISNNAFANCKQLSTITIPGNVESIGDNAFLNCTKFDNIGIPNSINSIGSKAFYGCTGATSFTIPATVTSVGASAFGAIPNCRVLWYYNPVLTAANFCSELVGVNWPSSSFKISANSFKGCTKLTSVTLPNNLTGIGDNAFAGCTGITKIKIPSNVTELGVNVFQNCSNLSIYTEYRSKPSGWQNNWNGSRTVYWAAPASADIITGFGYEGTSFYWRGAVNMSFGNTNEAYYRAESGIYYFLSSSNIILNFKTRTTEKKNAVSKINGTLTFNLKNSSGSVVQTHTTKVAVSIVGEVSLTSDSFTISTSGLSNGTYTLEMTTSFTRAAWSNSETKKFVFVVDKQ